MTESDVSTGGEVDDAATAKIRELASEVVRLESDRRGALHKIVGEGSIQRSGMLRDSLNISVTLLIGAMTLYTVAPKLVKAPVVFFVSLTFLLVCLVVNLIARLKIVAFQDEAVASIETFYAKRSGAASSYASNATEENRVRMNVVFEEANEPSYRRLSRAGLYGHIVVAVLLLTGLVGVAFSLLFHMSL